VPATTQRNKQQRELHNDTTIQRNDCKNDNNDILDRPRHIDPEYDCNDRPTESILIKQRELSDTHCIDRRIDPEECRQHANMKQATAPRSDETNRPAMNKITKADELAMLQQHDSDSDGDAESTDSH